METYHLAFDLGASSGRTMLGRIADDTMTLSEINRFTNQTEERHGHLVWNTEALFNNMADGLALASAYKNFRLDSMGIDTWGVDYALIPVQGTFNGFPFAYRDDRCLNAMKDVFHVLSEKKLYALTGIQMLSFNTVFQLYAEIHEQKTDLTGTSLLFIPDLFIYLFTGDKGCDRTIASTSQLLKPGKQEWESEIFGKLEIPLSMMPKVSESGSCAGTHKGIQVIRVAGHDTASAVAAVPVIDKHFAFISSGTWSVMGIESARPVINESARKHNFSNEAGVEGSTRVLKNIMGLWLIQQCHKLWNEEREISFSELMGKSEASHPFRFYIDPDDPCFLSPSNMIDAIRNYCVRTKQEIPATEGEFARTILEGLAFKYKKTLEELMLISPFPIKRIHVIGGGCQNTLLNQFIANVTGLEVYAGPVEATSLGNIMVQAIALQQFKNIDEARALISRSFSIKRYQPENESLWNQSYLKFNDIVSR